MMFRIRRTAANALVVALAAGASVALGPAAGGASTPRPAVASSGVGVNGLCGGVVVAPTPTGLRQGQSESNSLRVFRERLDYALVGGAPADVAAIGLYDQPTDLPSPRPTVAGGTHVNSYILHSDPPGQVLVRTHRAATIGFTSDVLGVQVLSATLSDPKSLQLRAPGTQYTNNASGLELAVGGGGDYARIVNRRTVAVSFKTSSAVDEIRVITKATTSEASALKGYRMLASDGGVFDFGGQQFYGSTGGRVLNKPVVAGVNTCGNAGYWFVASDGGVFSYGDARFYGSLGAEKLAAPVVGMAATPTGAGYYLVLANGEVRVFGDARSFGDAGRLHLNRPIVGMAVTPSGLGYWLVAGDGGIFSYGDAETHFYGSTGNIRLVSPIIGMFAAVDGLGYYMYAADGGMFVFQQHPPLGTQVHEPFFGSAGGSVRANPIVGARLAADGQGYWFDDSAGVVYAFGPSAPKATPVADMSGVALFRPMIGMM
ncbi:MAG: hypothetical protein QOH10_2683 [Actinomycetota bacterium]|nr:hypothetical protein [Actinomycetota bacterium]